VEKCPNLPLCDVIENTGTYFEALAILMKIKGISQHFLPVSTIHLAMEAGWRRASAALRFWRYEMT
jgi:hypothetical protein